MARVSRPCAFLDRDGTINTRPPEHEYVTSEAQFEWLPGAVESLVRLARAGYALGVASNQRGVARGLVDGISSTAIDGWYERARDAGATGGKILGAGAGGFLLISAPPERHAAVRAALSELREVPVRFSGQGSTLAVLGHGDV